MLNARYAGFLVVAACVSGMLIHQSSAAAEPHTVISFADIGGINSWKPGPNDTLLIEGRKGQWYRASFWGPCSSLRFSEAIAFVTEPTGELDKYSSILADGERCWFRTFDKISPP
jgi:hypothetical protein